MAIKFNCPHCRKPFNVKDELAGRRAQCPACKNGLTVPAPRAQPADLEAFAAAALADEPKPQAAAPVEHAPIEFECPFCNEKVKVGAELSGKQTPCPECRRIVKVPLLKKEEPKDWRKLDTRLLAGARREEAPAPEGAWSTSSIGTVSRTSLIEAQAIPQKKERWTWQQWVKRGAAAAIALAVLGLGTWMVLGRLAANERKQALTRALAGIDDGKYQPEAVAELHRAAGDYLLRDNKPDGARFEYQTARAALMAAPDKESLERELALIDLLLAQVDLAGNQKEIDERTRLRWDDVHTEIRRTWQNLETPEGRIDAMRRLSRKLIARGQGLAAVSLASQFPERSELLAVIGLQALRSGDDPKVKVEQLALQAERSGANSLPQPVIPAPAVRARPGPGQLGDQKPGADANVKKPQVNPGAVPSAPSLIALWLVLGKTDKAMALAPPPQQGKKVEPVALLGYVQGLARLDRWDEARGLVQLAATPLDRLRGLVALAEVAAEKEKIELARAAIEAGGGVAHNELKGSAIPPWLLYRLAQLALEAELVKPVQAVLRLLPDAALRGRVQLEELQARLAGAAGPAETSWADAVDKNSLARGLALEAITRHNAARKGGRALLKEVAGWEVEKLRPFGYIGITLGLQDRDK